MEDVFRFLLVIGIIVVGFVRQAKKEAKKKAANNPAMPIPEKENSLPENWGGETYGGYIPKGPQPEAAVTPQKAEKPKPFKAQTAIPKNTSKEPSRYKADSLKQKVESTPVVQETNETSDFQIHSPEEAKRAIIWSEILQRKY